MRTRKITINLLLLVFLISLISGCAFLNDKPEINAYIQGKNLKFELSDKNIFILAYDIKSLEDFREDGLTYKTVLHYENYDGFHDVIIKDYKKRNILDNHAYYLLLSKEGAVFQSLGFCIHNTSILLQKKNSNDQGFVHNCHGFRSS